MSLSRRLIVTALIAFGTAAPSALAMPETGIVLRSDAAQIGSPSGASRSDAAQIESPSGASRSDAAQIGTDPVTSAPAPAADPVVAPSPDGTGFPWVLVALGCVAIGTATLGARHASAYRAHRVRA